jgi:hypothetical protein
MLFGEVSQVVKGIRQSVTKRKLLGVKRKTLCGVADYLYRNRARMRYDEYLAQGWPIASGAVEGACKNLIKDRMERSGMRWTEQMAEAIVQLRAIYLSGDFDRFWSFHNRKRPAAPPSRSLECRSKVATPKSFLDQHQAWQAQQPIPAPAQQQAMRFYHGTGCVMEPSGLCPWLMAEGDITDQTLSANRGSTLRYSRP